MKIHEFSIKSQQCHCEEPTAGDEAISVSTITGIASLRRGGFARNDKSVILALGAESAGSFSVFTNTPLIKGARGIFFSDDFGDLLDDNNYKKFQKAVLEFLRKNKIKPDIILTDLHPLYKTTILGAELAKKYKAKHIQVQHHLAHIFSAIGEKQIIENCKLKIENCFGIALDGTGYGLDGKIWGGEIFKISPLIKGVGGINRIGHLENQIMIGGDLAIHEPARMLISILSKFQKKEAIYKYLKKYYTKNQFELLYNQLQNNFNCQETSSTGRILDAVSLLLDFCKNKRNYKHEPIELLEKNSTKPYKLPPLIKGARGIYTLRTTPLFEYLIKNLHKDKRRLAATAQLYIAKGIYKIIENCKLKIDNCFVSGGISNNKIISSFLESKDFYTNKKFPRGDAGISFGQIIYYLLKK
jgi:hydrogenase maturation protein HypF